MNLNKINKWEEIKGQSLWINATLEEQKEINNSRHLCFSFMTSALNDLLNFSTNLSQYNKENEKKKKFRCFSKTSRKLRPTNLPIKIKKNKLIFY